MPNKGKTNVLIFYQHFDNFDCSEFEVFSQKFDKYFKYLFLIALSITCAAAICFLLSQAFMHSHSNLKKHFQKFL